VTRALDWVRARDPGLLALRRAGRGAIVMPALFAVGDKWIANPQTATFAAFGSFALLLLVDFQGPMRDRLFSQAALGLAGAALVCVGTLASRATWLAVVVTAIVGFLVLFAGVVSSVIASATVSLLLTFILPVSLRAPASAIPDRLAGFGLAAGVSLLAISLLWPAPPGDRLRAAAVAACRGIAVRLRAEAAFLRGGADDREEAALAATAAVAALHKTFYGTPYRPTGLSTAARAVVRLVDEIFWLAAIVDQTRPHPPGMPVNEEAVAVKSAVAEVLDQGAALLGATRTPPGGLRAALEDLRARLGRVEESAVTRLQLEDDDGTLVSDVVSALDPGFRAQELSFAVSQIGANIDIAAAAERRSWLDRMTGRSPKGLPGTFAAAGQRAAAHFEPHSVWLHNSLRGATGLSLAVLVASLTGVQHSFWVVLGTLSVLRSNALNTGQTVVRGLAGTAAGVLVGAGLIELIGTNETVLWILLPAGVLVAGFAPAAVSFAAGQAAFSVVLVILFNIIQPVGWHVGLVRIEDVAIGFGVSLAVGVLFWPRGAGHALAQELAEAYAASARYLAAAVEFGVTRCDRSSEPRPEPVLEGGNASAAARRLDDAFRTYLAERSAKRVALADVTALVNGVVGLRLAADAVLDLWQRGGRGEGDRAAARAELVSTAGAVAGWYEALGSALLGAAAVPEPLDPVDDGLVEAVAHDLRDDDGTATELGVRIIWTGDHLDAARRLQRALAEPARAVADRMLARPGVPTLRPSPIAADS
jgi:Fusaric acid resistance protein-like